MKLFKTSIKKKKAFSVTDNLIWLILVGIALTGTIVFGINTWFNRAREANVQADFRTFSLASEQLIRENSGIKGNTNLATITPNLNRYLDESMKFSTAGSGTCLDPWNNPYRVDIIPESTTSSNGAIVFISGGKNGVIDGIDDYIMATAYYNGNIATITNGFTKNTLHANFYISRSASNSFSVTGGDSALSVKRTY